MVALSCGAENGTKACQFTLHFGALRVFRLQGCAPKRLVIDIWRERARVRIGDGLRTIGSGWGQEISSAL
eukprot:5274733-Pyramimonas_sp.AAC.1